MRDSNARVVCSLLDVVPAMRSRSHELEMRAGDAHTQDNLEQTESIRADHAYAPIGSILAVRALEHAQHRSGQLATESLVLSPNDLIRNIRQSVEHGLHNAQPYEHSCAMSPGVHERGEEAPQTRTKSSGKGSHIGPCRVKWQCGAHDNYCL